MAQHWLSRAYRRMGLLFWLSLASLSTALFVHHTSRLPGPYTWFESLRTLRRVLARPGFPIAVSLVYGLGCWVRRGDWNVEEAARQLASEIELRAFLPFARRGVSCVCAVVLVDAFVLGADRGPLDLVALAGIGLVLAIERVDRRRLLQETGYAAFGALVFLVICYCFTVVKALTFVSGRHYDAAIVNLEIALFGVAPHRVLAVWAAQNPSVAELCDWVYFHFFEHMALTTVLLAALRKRAQSSQYLGALALCYLIGGPLYHLWPAQGPSYFEPRYFGFLDRPGMIAGGIRRWLELNTDDALNGTATRLRTWGYIACMPSLHIAHELVMLYYSRGSRPAFALSLLFTLLTLLSVVVLGWHYPLDALGGAVVAALAIAIVRWQGGVLMPSALVLEDAPDPSPAKPVVARFFKAYLAARRLRAAAKP